MIRAGSMGALVFGLVLFVSPISRADDKKVELANPDAGKCPVSHKAIDEKITAEVDGKTYAFCCEKCEKKFKEHPEKFLKKKHE